MPKGAQQGRGEVPVPVPCGLCWLLSRGRGAWWRRWWWSCARSALCVAPKPASSPLKRAAFPSHPKAPCQARLLWLGVALLVDVVVLLWLCGVEGALRCVWMKNEVGHVTTSRTTNGSCGHQGKRAGGLLATQKRNAGAQPHATAAGAKGLGSLRPRVCGPRRLGAKARNKKGEPEPPTQANGADPLPARQHLERPSHDVAEAGCTIGAPCGGRAGQEACPVHVCV